MLLASLLSIVLGILVGIITAVRQYSVIDYSSTFAAFLFYSLPVFWLAVLLKEFGAIRFNDFLEAPGFSVTGIIILSVLPAIFAYGIVPGDAKRRALVAAVTGVVFLVGLVIIDATDWMLNPGLSLPVIALLVAADRGRLGGTVRAAREPSGAGRRRGHRARRRGRLGRVQLVDRGSDAGRSCVCCSCFSLVTGAAVGSVVGGEIDRRAAVSAGMWATIGVGLVVAFDQFISAWEPGRTIATIGPQSPNFTGRSGCG